ncbi:hypothetical protein PybrP1_012507 [[Pythium] brassicae (nom. inval.)]|nr:hypothetical protein PybrP1_012507 [[Pythium] brassicae (nom. inval.)]
MALDEKPQRLATATVPPPPLMGAADNEIPIRVTLGGATLRIGAQGGWELEHSALQELAAHAKELETSNSNLVSENAALRERCARLTEEANMDKFKCQLLIEMLALASLDEERSKSEAEQEKAKAASVQRDMLALLEQAQREGLDVKKIASVMAASPGSREVEKSVAPPQPSRPQTYEQDPTPTRPTSTRPSSGNGGAGSGNGSGAGGPRAPAPPSRGPKPPTGTGASNSGVDFDEFKDDEKNVVETMLESNKGLRMAEINFHDLKLSKIIGAGAFGEVIKGTYCGTPVVVKRMLRNKITEDNLRMFGEEIQLMMNLRHPNIVQFIGASWNSYSNICFVTEFLERGDLFAVLRNPENTLTWAKPILRMTIDTSRGMAYLHSMKPPIIHRDLKSMNILVSSTWGTKVSDFGLSREKSVDETMSVTGTPLWLPPEMIRGERYTEKADVYSFGIGACRLVLLLLYCTLMHMVAYENLRPSLSPNCMDSVRDLYNRCTADDQAQRPTFEEIVQVLENNVRKETLMRANEMRVEAPQSETDVSPEELGVFHATNYLD